MESDFQEPQTIDTRVVMGEEARLKTMELKTGQQFVKPSPQALPNFPEPRMQGNESRRETKKEENQVQTLQKQQDPQKEPIQPPNTLSLTFNSDLCSLPSEPSRATDDNSDDKQEASVDPTQDEVPCRVFSELACPVALSFSEPAYAVDPLRVGVPSSLDPDLYYTAPSTPIKMSSCSSHLKHHSYPGSPACPLSPGSPSDSEDLCSPLTSPSGSYITAEGGSWTSSYTSSTSPSASPNLLLIEEAQEAPACFVASLSEIGDEVGDDKGRAGSEREGERAGELCLYRPEDYVSNSQAVIPAILEEDEVLKDEEVKSSRESGRPCWVTDSMLHHRSSSSHSSDSQDNGGGSESSLCPLEEATEGRDEYPRAKQACLKLPLEACMSQDSFGQLEDHLDLRSTTITPDIEDSTLASSSVSPDSPMIPLDDFCRGAFGRLCPNSYMFSQAVCADDIPEDERMIPASLLSFPLNTSLVFRADSMEITLFPTEDENEIEEGDDRNEEKDVNAYAAGEEEADVEDDDDDEENYDFDDDVEIDNSGNHDDEEDEDSDGHAEDGTEAKVEVKVVEEKQENEEEEEEDEDEEDEEDECDSKRVEDPTEDDSSASFLHSLSDTSINEGLDESFCFQDDTDDSLDSASYNGEEDESLYSTERHAQSLEPTQEDPDLADVKQEPQHGTNVGESQSQHVCVPQNTDESDLFSASYLSQSIATHQTGHGTDSTIMDQFVSPQSGVELEHTSSELGHMSSLDMQEHTENPVENQEPSHPSEAASCQQESSSNLDLGSRLVGCQNIAKLFALCEQPPIRPFFDPATSTVAPTDDSNISHTSPSVSQDMIKLAPAMAEATTKVPDLDLKQSTDISINAPTKEQSRTIQECAEPTSDYSDEEPMEEPERDSYKLLIKPRHRQTKSHMSIGASRLALAKSFSMKVEASGEANTMFGPNNHKGSGNECHQKNRNAAAESKGAKTRSSESGFFLNKASATNDLNKGVPLLSCPKDPTSNPSNIPLSTLADIIPEVADNLALTPEHCPRDCAQENLRENTLSTDEGALGAAGSPHSPLAISPKRENSETDVSREMVPGAGAWQDHRMGLGFGLGLGSGAKLSVWGAGEALSLSLEKKYELESESLLMCDTKGQSAEMVVAPNISDDDCKIYDHVMGFVLDEEDNNSESEEHKEAADQGLEGRGTSQSNIKCWKSIGESSGQGEYGSSTSPGCNPNPSNNLDNTDAQPQESWRNSDNNNNSAFDPSDVAMYGNLNALSEEVRHQGGSVSVRESLSNIPLEEIPNPVGNQQAVDCKSQTSFQAAGTCRVSVPSTDTFMQKEVTKQIFSLSDKSKSVNKTVMPEGDAAISWLNGSFGSFTPKSKSKESGPKPCQGDKRNADANSDLKSEDPEDDAQRKDEKSAATSRLLSEPKRNETFGGQQRVVCNSGDEDVDKKAEEAKRKGEKKGKKNKREIKTAPEPNCPESFECPKGKDSTEKPAVAKRGRRGRQRKQRALQTGGHIDSSPESVDDPKKASLVAAADRSSNETPKNPQTKTGQMENRKSSPLESLKASSGPENAESASWQRGSDSNSEGALSPESRRSTTQTSPNLNAVAVNPEPFWHLGVLDYKPLRDSHVGATVDVNDGNREPDPCWPHQDAPPCPSSSTRPALPSAPPPESESDGDLPTPVQESQPVQSAGPLLCSACTTTQEVFNPSLVLNDALRQGLPVLPPSTLTLPSKQPAQEAPTPGPKAQDLARVPDSAARSQSQFFSQRQPKPDAKQSKPLKQSCIWSAQDRHRGKRRPESEIHYAVSVCSWTTCENSKNVSQSLMFHQGAIK